MSKNNGRRLLSDGAASHGENANVDVLDRLFDPNNPFVGVREIRKALNVSDKWVRRGLARGTFPRPDYKLGASLRWRRSSVERYLSEHAVKATP